ncbi:uncharacterized protein LOC123543237 [Mercenaria mercenaria]|uniref:uncharacterized protein LOC123543237 n=1 Tax=Mercenaria mercenaria TaxID=6596 RepID=UPI00234F49A9|nr:uncharacterized protein LOC123543237 [Mercenaria mercenaria]
MADKYYRLVSFLVNICPQPLRELFLKYMNADPTRAPTCTTVDAYLASKKPQLQVLQRRKLIRQDQWQLLFPMTGQVDESSWDITLVILLLDEFFKMQLQQLEEDAIQHIRVIRNRLQHMSETSIADADFDVMWNILEKATIDLAKQIQPSPAYKDRIKKDIDDTKINNMPRLGDSLRYWYEHIIMQLKLEIEDMKEIIKEMSEHTADNAKCSRDCWTILQESSVKTVGPSGDKVKRMKTVDQILAKLNKYFITTLKEDLPANFDSPPEVADIKTKLRDVHHVVVTGFRDTRYLETALAAIHSMKYNHNRCVEMRDSSDWRHVDPEEVDLVLCREPFGDFTFDEKRTKSMADIFSNMLQTARASDGSKHLDIVIVCDVELLQQVSNVHGHDILEEVVQVYQPTSETTPADLTGITKESEGVISASAQNLLDFTAVFMDRNRDDTLHSKIICDKAKSMLKMNKVVLITGPKKCGKTVLALYLASVYQPHQFLILNKPEDIKLVSLSSICLVLVEDFAGKYRFEEGRACAWLEKFDMLYSVVGARKLNVIITCEEKLLKKCREEFGPHPILGNIITLQHTDRVVKSEATNGETSNGNSRTQCETPMITDDGQNITESAYTTEKQNASSDALQPEKINRNLHSSDVFFIVEDMCPFGDDKFLFLNTSATVSLLNSDLDVVGTFETHEQGVEKICQTGDQELLIVSDQRLSLYEFKTESIERIQTKNIEHGCDCLAVGEDGEVSILDGNTIYIYSELQLTYSQRLPVKERKEDDEKKMVLFSDKQCVIIAKRNCIKSVMFSSSKHLKRSLHFNKKNVNPISLCTGDDDVFLLCSYKQTHAKIMRYTCDLEKIGVLDLADVHYAPSLTSMMFHRQTSRLLVTCSGNLDEWHWDKHAGFKLPKSERNQFTTAFTRVRTTTTNEIGSLNRNFNSRFCQHPDGSFLFLQCEYDDDDDDDDGDFSLEIHHFSSDFQYIRKYNTDISYYPEDDYCDICCTDSGDVVIDANGEVTLYRITDGTVQNIKSNSNAHRDSLIAKLCFFMNRIYITFGDYASAIVMLDTNLNVKKRVKLYLDLYEDLNDFPVVVPCVMQKYLYIHPENDSIICDDPKKKQMKYMQVEGFKPQCICAASEDSVFVVGIQDLDDRRILQVNTDMEILSDIPLKRNEFKYTFPHQRIVFDKVKARLVLYDSWGEVKQIYLE